MMRSAVRFGFFSLLLVASPLAAQDAASNQPPPLVGRIGFVNVQALLRGMPGYAEAESTYAEEFQAGQAEAQQLQTAFDSTVADYQQSQATLTPEDRTAREQVLQAQRDTVFSQVQAIEARVAAREHELLASMQDRLRAVIDGVRAEGNFAMIIDLTSSIAGGIIAYDKALDVTLEVASRLASGE